MDFDTITLAKENYIATITLNRPQKLNAITEEMFTDLATALGDINRDDEARVVVPHWGRVGLLCRPRPRGLEQGWDVATLDVESQTKPSKEFRH